MKRHKTTNSSITQNILQSRQASRDGKIRTAIVSESHAEPLHELSSNPQLEASKYDSLSTFLESNQVKSDKPATLQDPELIVIAQTFPDQFSPTQIDHLFEKHPLSRILFAYDSLCESDGRTRNLCPQSVRVPLWKLHQRITREIDVLLGNSPALPLTATREEIVHFEHQTPLTELAIHKPSPAQAKITAIVFSPDAAWTELIAETWQSAFHTECKKIHTLENLGTFLTSENELFYEIILDIDPFNPLLKQWLEARQHYNCKKNKPIPLMKNQGNNTLEYASATKEIRTGNDQFIATSNWLISHHCKELQQLGINRFACKLNLPEILRISSLQAIS